MWAAARQARGPSAAARQARGPSAEARQAKGPKTGEKMKIFLSPFEQFSPFLPFIHLQGLFKRFKEILVFSTFLSHKDA